jgi:hypothetical protein
MRMSRTVLALSVLISGSSCAAKTTTDGSAADGSAADATSAAVASTAAIETTAATASSATIVSLETITVATSETTAPAEASDILTIQVDWNGDGVEDTFRREYVGGHEKDGILTFMDGATGKTTDVTSCCGLDG